MTPYYECDGITIYHGDCLEVLPTLAAGAAEWVITDPPYNCGKSYGIHDDAMSREIYLGWCREWFNECRRIAKGVVVFPGHGNLPMWWDIAPWGHVGCWYKPGNPAGGGLVQFCEWEPWLLWGKRMRLSNVIRAPITEQRDTGDHPCPKPILLSIELFKRTQASTVLDPFMGSGTTLVVAQRAHIPAIGIELEERYCEIAAQRLAQAALPLWA